MGSASRWCPFLLSRHEPPSKHPKNGSRRSTPTAFELQHQPPQFFPQLFLLSALNREVVCICGAYLRLRDCYICTYTTYPVLQTARPMMFYIHIFVRSLTSHLPTVLITTSSHSQLYVVLSLLLLSLFPQPFPSDFCRSLPLLDSSFSSCSGSRSIIIIVSSFFLFTSCCSTRTYELYLQLYTNPDLAHIYYK